MGRYARDYEPIQIEAIFFGRAVCNAILNETGNNTSLLQNNISFDRNLEKT